ncbi:MAG: transposase [Actinobacteria bacterium]|nr:transposase [Actinomycetota bacterium]
MTSSLESNKPSLHQTQGGSLVANCVIFHTTLDMMAVLRQLVDEGWTIDPEDLAVLSPYIRERIKRFGEYVIDGLADPPEAFDPHLDLPDVVVASQAA